MVDVERELLVRAIRSALEDRPEVLDAYLFGSQARGEAAAHSDVDVAIFVDRGALEKPGFGIDSEVSAELMTSLGMNRVDVVILNRAGPLLYHRVLRDGIRVLSRDLQATTTREGYALSRYFDFLPQLRKIDRARSARVERGEFGR